MVLDSEKRGLEVQVADLVGEVDRFRQDLYESQQNEKVWREQFVLVSKSVGGEKGEDPGGIADVEECGGAGYVGRFRMSWWLC